MSDTPPPSLFHFIVTAELAGQRLDRYLAEQPTLACSRSYLKQLIEAGQIQVDGKVRRASYKVVEGAEIAVALPPPAPLELIPEDIPLDILHEDPYLIVVNKPVGMVVHPAAGHTSGTLVHALLYHCDDLAGIGGAQRPGIVHRIDRDTSGVLVVAKTDEAHQGLSYLFRERPEGQISRRYLAIARGNFREDRETIDTPYGRHPTKRQQFSSRFPAARRAITHFEVVERFELATLLEVRLETGRTHQIRVHMADRGRSLIGDVMYGARTPPRWPKYLSTFPRQALHAKSLSFVHPVTGEALSCEAPPPPDMQTLLSQLRGVPSLPKN